jgi:protein-S-isoprenylcysteine O-methyltransferase Ste14
LADHSRSTRREGVSLAVRNILFMIAVPGLGAVYAPWWLLTRNGYPPHPVAWPALIPIVIGAALYLWCVWLFAVVGRGTPGPWDSPRRFVAAGPYRWVRNPIYLAAFLVIGGEAWLFLSPTLLLYLLLLTPGVHLFVLLYEEPNLSRRFGEEYATYTRAVPRWIPRPTGREGSR